MKYDFSKDEYDYFVEQCGFTDEELQILNLLRRGKSHKEIESETFKCLRTISTKVKSIKKKITKCIEKMESL